MKLDHMFMWIYKQSKSKDDDPKAPFSIATTLRCSGGHYSFPWIVPLYPWSVPYNARVKQGGMKYHFWIFGITQPGIEPRSPGPLVNNLHTWQMGQYEYTKACQI